MVSFPGRFQVLGNVVNALPRFFCVTPSPSPPLFSSRRFHPKVLATIYALFAPDFLLLALPKSADVPHAIISAVVLGLFVIELVAQSFVFRKEYFLRVGWRTYL